MDFKPGDKVRCIHNGDLDGRLIVNQIYTVNYTEPGRVILVGKPHFSFYTYRFILDEPPCTPGELVNTLLLFAQWLVKPRPLQVGELVRVRPSPYLVYKIVAIHADKCWIVRAVDKPNDSGFLCATSGLFRADGSR